LKIVKTFGDAIYLDEGDEKQDDDLDLEEAGDAVEDPVFLRNPLWNRMKLL
jgi:hypothetical protein